MKKLLFLAILLFSVPAFAGPFMTCDPQTGVTSYKLTGPAWVPATVPAEADGSIHMDVAASPVGENSLTVAACTTHGAWGELCSVFVPFVFARPGLPAAPSGFGLAP